MASSYSVCRRNQGSPYGPAGNLPQVFLCLPAGQTHHTLSTRGRGRETEGFSAPEMPPWGSSSEHRRAAAAATGGEPWPEGPPTDPFQQVTMAPQRRSASAGSQGNRMEKDIQQEGRAQLLGEKKHRMFISESPHQWVCEAESAFSLSWENLLLL